MRVNRGFVLAFVLVLLIGILFRQVWLYAVIERDEGGIALVSLQWIHGLLPYVSSFNNAGPLAYVTYAFSTLLFGIGFIPIRMINNIIFFLSIIPFYLCAKDWSNRKIALISSLFYGIFMSAPIYEGQLVLTSSLSAPIIVFSVFFCSRYVKNESPKALMTSGFLASVAILINVLVSPLFFLLLGAVALRYLRSDRTNNCVKELRKDLLVAMIGVAVIPAIFLLYFAYMEALGNIITVFIYLSLGGHLTGKDVPLGILLSVVAQGLPLWILAVLGFIGVVFKRNKFSFLLIGWLLFGIAIASFPPHFGHRFLYLIGPTSVLAGVGVTTTIKRLKISLKKRSNSGFVFSLFATVLLIMSLPIAIVAQKEQYPQYNIDSNCLNFQWLYADETNYFTQTRLGEFLRSNCPPESSILVHGWAAEIYYLADKLPPSKYVWSRPDPGVVEIPENEYSKFVEGVEHREFEFVVFFDNSRETLEFRRDDPVVNQTLNNYFYFGNIDNALIFTK
jgi:4-amino-4-deoxy-L-arabinose transferase-like glycosyltransferase